MVRGRGNLERMVHAMRSGWLPSLPGTVNQRSLVHVQDVHEVTLIVTERPEANGRTYVLVDPCAYSGRQIYGHIRAALGLSMSSTLFALGSLMLAVGRMNFRLGEVVDCLICSECYSPVLIEVNLGWRARVYLSEGLREMVSKTDDFR